MKDKDGNIPRSATDKIKIIEEWFKATLSPPEMKEEFLEIAPCKMRVQFTVTEIQGLAKRLKWGKAGLCPQIAQIFNDTAATGDTPEALIYGLLQPIQKPGKPKRTTGESTADHPTQYSEKDTDDSTPRENMGKALQENPQDPGCLSAWSRHN